jgi:hypothetical protein
MEKAPDPQDALRHELQELRHNLILRDPDIHDQMMDRAAYLQSKYPDTFYDYEMYHFLISSNIGVELPLFDQFDFPGEDSVEKFIRSL